MSIRAIVLAAGRGSRLAPCVGDRPKCLVRVGGMSLLERQLLTLRTCGVGSVTVVAGYRIDLVSAACRPLADIVENTRFAETNSLYSLWLARPLLDRECVVLNSDVLFHPQLMADLLTARHDDALLVDFRGPDRQPLGEEEMKVKVRSGCVVAMSKELSAEESDGENVGIARFSAAGARQLSAELDAIVSEGGVRQWVPAAFTRVARRRSLHAVSTRGFPWIEIDFPDDLRRASEEVLPQLDGAGDEAPETEAPPPVPDGSLPSDWRPQTGHV